MKKYFLISWLFLSAAGQAQTKSYSLEQCYELARQNYPLIKKQELISKSSQYSVENAGKLYLPQFSVSGQATYQSETIDFQKVIGPIPGVSVPALSKDQYKIQAEVDQTIYDGGMIKNQQELIRASAASQQQSLEIALFALKERINQLYFSILLIREQISQNNIIRDNFQSSADKTKAAYQNGTSLKSNVDEFLAGITSTEMQNIELRSNLKAYTNMLSVFIGQPLDENADLQMPSQTVTDPVIRRPELVLYDLNKKIYDVQDKQLKSDYLPRLNAFAQGAYGRPTLNIIENEFGPWWIGGIRMSWNLGSLYALKNNRSNLKISKASLDVDKATFLYNTNLDLSREGEAVNRYAALLKQDDSMIVLRSSIATAAKAQLDNGVITVHDYITKMNEENLARQSKILHAIQLLQAQYQYKNTTGN